MKIKCNNFDKLYIPILMDLFNVVADKGYEIYFVGGAVRDSILNLDVFDIDITTNAQLSIIEDFIVKNNTCFKGFNTNERYGVISTSVNFNGEEKTIQISLMRSDIKTYGRQADVILTSNRKIDAKRRDFTINALYLDKNRVLYDDNGGMEDLKNGKIKFIGFPFVRIKEDYLRILRLYRFYGRFGKEKPSFFTRLCCRYFSKRLYKISEERIRYEVLGILKSKNVLKAVQMMNDDGISRVVFGKSVNMKMLSYVVNKSDDVRVRLFVCCNGNLDNLSGFVLTKSEKQFYVFLINSLKCKDLTPKARVVLYGREVCSVDSIFSKRQVYNGDVPDFSQIRAELVDLLIKDGVVFNKFGEKIKIAYKQWLLSDCSASVWELFKNIKSGS